MEAPPTAAEPCALYRIEAEHPTRGDLEIGYHMRGAQIATCDTARRLAIDALAIEHQKQDAWLADRERRRHPFREFFRYKGGGQGAGTP